MKKSALVFTLLAVILMIAIAGCGEKKETAQSAPQQTADHPQAAPTANSNEREGKVLETMNSGGYTYVYVDTGSEKLWAAGPATTAAVGQVVVMDKGMPMPEFHAKSLDRTFDVIYFVSYIRAAGEAGQAQEAPQGGMGGMGGMGAAGAGDGSSHSQVEKTEVSGVAKAADGYTVEEIFTQSSALSGKPVKVRGQVVKFTPNIMGTNWVHIQDGTGSGATADLTVTTSATVAAGDLVVVEGPLTINKDFGAGYKYAAIIENASITKE